MDSILKIEKMNKKNILSDISLELDSKEIVALVGPNGSGKSTLMKCIMGFSTIDTGNIYLNGYSLTERKMALQGVSCSIEYPTLYPDLNGNEHFKLFSKLKKISQDTVEQYKEFSGLGFKLKQKIKYYSVGMKQILMLSLTMMQRPKLLILDEPLNGLDIQTKKRVLKHLKKLNEEGATILWSSHEVNQLKELSNRFIFIYKGRIVDILNNDFTLEELEDHYLKVCL